VYQKKTDYVFQKYSTKLGRYVVYNQSLDTKVVHALQSKEYDLSKIYTDSYFIDTDYGWKTRTDIVHIYIKLLNLFIHLKSLQICDYGAGNGYLSKTLLENGYNILAYESYYQGSTCLEKRFVCNSPFEVDVLLMIEVFEHFINPLFEIETILKDFKYPRLILFTTSLTDNAPELIHEWDYIDPDSGHFTIWSKKGLTQLGNVNGYRFISLDNLFFHVFCKESEEELYTKLNILSKIIQPIVQIRQKIKEFVT
jgi:hypothetical protein